MLHAYRIPAKILHWLVAVAVIVMVPVGTVMLADDLDRALRNTLFITHKNLGVVILALMVARLLYRLRHRPAALPATTPQWQQRVATGTHVLLYAAVFFMAITGYLRVSWGGFPIEGLGAIGLHPLLARNDALADIAKAAHGYGRFALVALVGIHIGAALYHAVILRDGVFGRIWPFWRA